MTNTDNLTIALVFVLCVNVMMALSQTAVDNLNPDKDVSYYNPEDSLLCNFDNNNCADENYYIDDSQILTKLPTGEQSITPTTGLSLTDTFTTIKAWFNDKAENSFGFAFVRNLITAPANFLKATGLPPEFVGLIGLLWYGATIFLIVAFMIGR